MCFNVIKAHSTLELELGTIIKEAGVKAEDRGLHCSVSCPVTWFMNQDSQALCADLKQER